MKIVAIGCLPSDLETGCLATLLKFIKKGHKVYIVITNKKPTQSKKIIASYNKVWKKIGISKILFADEFDHSVVTQKNVYILRSFIEPINPEIVLFPSPIGADKNLTILGKSSILACRGVNNILMYESKINSEFSPQIFSVINDTKVGKIYFGVDKKHTQDNKKTMKKNLEFYKKYSRFIRTNMIVEAFDTNRILLLNNDVF